MLTLIWALKQSLAIILQQRSQCGQIRWAISERSCIQKNQNISYILGLFSKTVLLSNKCYGYIFGTFCK